MTTHPYIPLYVDDFEAATAHLSPAEDGIYNRLLRLCWRTPGCSIPDDATWIARKIRITAEEFDALAKPVIDEFFARSRGRIFQKRLKAEHDDISRKKTARKNAGKIGGLAKSRKDKEKTPSNATTLPADTRAFPEPYPEPDKLELSVGPEGPTEGGLFGDLPVEKPEVDQSADAGKPWDRDPEFQALWLAATPEGRKRAGSKAATWPEWVKAKKRAPAAAIRAAMSIYKIQDPDVARTGGPGLHIWLKRSAFEPYLQAACITAPEAKARPVAAFDGPPELRALAVTSRGEGFAASYIDHCRWDQATRTLIPRGFTAFEKLDWALGPDLRRLGISLANPDANVVPIRAGVGA